MNQIKEVTKLFFGLSKPKDYSEDEKKVLYRSLRVWSWVFIVLGLLLITYYFIGGAR